MVIEEINSYLDNPAEYIFDEYEEMVFPDQPIGRSILGMPATVRAISGDSMRRFIASNYSPSQMVFCSVGAISPKQIKALFEKHFSNVPAGNDTRRKRSEYLYKPVSIEKKTGHLAEPLHHRQHRL